MINFKQPVDLSTEVSSMGVLGSTSPNATVFRNNLYVFFVGVGENGAFFTSYDGTAWTTPVTQVASDLGIMAGTTVSTAVFENRMYLFYTGNGNNGVYYTSTSDGQSWLLVFPPVPGSTPMVGTTPNAIAFNGRLYLFYTDSGDDGISMVWTADGQNWNGPQLVPAQGLSVAQQTSPNAVVFGDTLYLFFTGGGGGGTFYTTTTDAVSWTPTASVGDSMGVQMTAGAGTSPAAVAVGSTLYLFWTGANGAGLWVASFDSTTWTFQNEVNTGSFLLSTSAWATEYNNVPYVFWIASDGNNFVVDYANWTPATT